MASAQFQRATTRRCIHRRKRIASTRLDSMAYGVLYVLVSAYTRIQRSLGARHSTTYKTRRSRAAESEESFVLPRITRTIRANRDGFTVLFPPIDAPNIGPNLFVTVAVKRKRDRSLKIQS